MVTEQRQAREQKRAACAAVGRRHADAGRRGRDGLPVGARSAWSTRAAQGPLREEITTIVNDIRLGESRAGALKSVRAPHQRAGGGVVRRACWSRPNARRARSATVLRSQADRMRTERFQRAEKEGATASQKLLLPLAVFIFPAVLIVLVGPVVLSFIYGGIAVLMFVVERTGVSAGPCAGDGVHTVAARQGPARPLGPVGGRRIADSAVSRRAHVVHAVLDRRRVR